MYLYLDPVYHKTTSGKTVCGRWEDRLPASMLGVLQMKLHSFNLNGFDGNCSFLLVIASFCPSVRLHCLQLPIPQSQ